LKPRHHKTLTELEGGDDWGPPSFPSALVARCHELRHKPLVDFTTEDLRVMVGQSIGLQFLIPHALDRLEVDPLAEGDLYPGDLLCSVLRVEAAFWRRHEVLRQRAAEVSLRALPLAIARDEGDVIIKALADAVRHFEQER
jgi:hypothetical protein